MMKAESFLKNLWCSRKIIYGAQWVHGFGKSSRWLLNCVLSKCRWIICMVVMTSSWFALIKFCHSNRMLLSSSPAHLFLWITNPFAIAITDKILSRRYWLLLRACCWCLRHSLALLRCDFSVDAVNPVSSGIARLRSSLNIWCNEKSRRAMPEKRCNESKAPQKTVEEREQNTKAMMDLTIWHLSLALHTIYYSLHLWYIYTLKMEYFVS